jgi:hypothetical protein
MKKWRTSNKQFSVLLLSLVALLMVSSLASAIDLTGVWSCDNGGTFYIRQLGNTIWWYGEDDANNPNWSNVAKGTISGSKITLTWADVPKGGNMLKGSLVLNIASDDELQATSQDGGFVGSTWTR